MLLPTLFFSIQNKIRKFALLKIKKQQIIKVEKVDMSGRPKTEDGRLKTGDRSRETGDRRPKTEAQNF